MASVNILFWRSYCWTVWNTELSEKLRKFLNLYIKVCNCIGKSFLSSESSMDYFHKRYAPIPILHLIGWYKWKFKVVYTNRKINIWSVSWSGLICADALHDSSFFICAVTLQLRMSFCCRVELLMNVTKDRLCWRSVINMHVSTLCFQSVHITQRTEII
jgi:hypothetical protein